MDEFETRGDVRSDEGGPTLDEFVAGFRTELETVDGEPINIQDRIRAMLDRAMKLFAKVSSQERDAFRAELMERVRAALHMRSESPTRQSRPRLVRPKAKSVDFGVAVPDDIVRTVRRLAPTDVPVVIFGETGTGKELIAQAMHGESGRSGKMVSVNCAAIPHNLLESALFGHERGAFSGAYKAQTGLFEYADNGTIFLDEIGEMSPAMQAKLLRVVQDGEIRRVGGDQSMHVDVRIIAATHRDLEEEVRAGRFREDLFFRLVVGDIHMPALRERGREVMVELIDHFCAENKVSISPGAKVLLMEYEWPGNIRQLKNAIESAAVICLNREIASWDLPENILETVVEPVRKSRGRPRRQP